VANTNDLRIGMRRVAEDIRGYIRGYYELTYTPPAREYDGKFRRISVKISRPGVRLQARSGYFALPPSVGSMMYPFEFLLLSALNSKPLPKDFESRARVLRFRRAPDSVDHALVIEVPLENFKFRKDKKNNLYYLKFSLMALVKDATGKIVHKMSQDYPLEGPLDRIPALKKGVVVFIRNFQVPPGRYTLETVALDRESDKSTAQKSVLIVPPPRPGVTLSSLTVIRRLDPPTENDPRPEGPLRVQKAKVIPNLGEPIRMGPGVNLGLYMAIYPLAGVEEKPELQLEFVRDGELVARSTPQLPAPDSQGRVLYLGTVPGEGFEPGRYQIRAVVRQGSTTAVEHAFFTVNP